MKNFLKGCVSYMLSIIIFLCCSLILPALLTLLLAALSFIPVLGSLIDLIGFLRHEIMIDTLVFFCIMASYYAIVSLNERINRTSHFTQTAVYVCTGSTILLFGIYFLFSAFSSGDPVLGSILWIGVGIAFLIKSKI